MGVCWMRQTSALFLMNSVLLAKKNEQSKQDRVVKDDADSLYHCPIQPCKHDGFQSQRGCRKHVNNKHSWFFYFDEKPRVDLKLAPNSSKVQTKSSAVSSTDDDLSSTRSKPGARVMPSFSPSGEIGEQLTTWLTGRATVTKRIVQHNRLSVDAWNFSNFAVKRRRN